MPTPNLYVLYAQKSHEVINKVGWKSFSVIILFALLPRLMEKYFNVLGAIPGQILFVILVLVVFHFVPYYLFLSHKNERILIGWLKTVICNILLIFSVWLIYSGIGR
ncbi:hypothetical protein H5187_23345 [Pseudoalteromonas sp. SG44-1]|uniref:hypothetical protein n=1 Tax=unclassified Pseudoalteromonas TaxID=194690 RepID=UPI0016017E4F|nr:MULTISPECIES: hypothetical protein [unclassified Pseudoalteromonas]MBB1420152.1 hypothetical protein [Pseudoalteromonas sp. SG44-1]MBB1436965.1 hypothetical protein [Pseudoalteromonas sp. SG43-6]MBB1482125.1 hypothetical protein [Pseudoalteromonas sp. SG41-2]